LYPGRRCFLCQLLLCDSIYIATKTQELRPALSVNTQPNHVLPLAHFGAISGVCDGAAWCGPITIIMLAREGSGSIQQYDLKVHHAPVGALLKPITGQAPPTAAPIGVSKGNLHI
jgi:hypothetical protein